MDQEVRFALRAARRHELRIRQRLAQRPRRVPRRTGGERPRRDAACRCGVRRAADAQRQAGAHQGVPLSAEQLVHRVSRRPHRPRRGSCGEHRPRAARGDRIRPAARPRRAARTAPPGRLLLGGIHRRDHPGRVRPGGEGRRRRAGRGGAHRALRGGDRRHPALPLREHDPHQHPCAAHPRRVRPAPRSQRRAPCGTPRALPCHEKALPSSLDDRASHRWRSPIRGASSG